MLLLRFTTRKINKQSSTRRLPGPPDSFTAELSPASFLHATTNPRNDSRNSALSGADKSQRAPFTVALPALRYRRIATMMKYYDHVSQCAVNLFLEPLRSVRICGDSVRKRTDTTLDQDCVLKANVQVCTACMIVSLLTTCLNLNTPPLAQAAPFRCKIRESNAEVTLDTKTQQARLPADSGLYTSPFPSLKRSPRPCTHTASSRQSVCTLSHPRASLGS